jgi:hypothetical protein
MGCYSAKFEFSYGRFGTTYWSNLQGSNSQRRIEILDVMGFYLDQFVFSYGRFGTTYQSNIPGASSPRRTEILVDMVSYSVKDYLVIDVSRKPIVRIFKNQEDKEKLRY